MLGNDSIEQRNDLSRVQGGIETNEDIARKRTS
jgi:hypothetical protein